MNICILRGNVGKDPIITDFENGGKVAQFTLATTERGFTTRDGKDVPEQTFWHNIVVRNKGLAGVCEQYVKKGTPLLVQGKIKNRKYTDSQGVEKTITEIHVDELELLGQKREQAPAPAPQGTYSGPQNNPAQQMNNPAPQGAPAPNDLPF